MGESTALAALDEEDALALVAVDVEDLPWLLVGNGPVLSSLSEPPLSKTRLMAALIAIEASLSEEEPLSTRLKRTSLTRDGR